jgi:soluble lytic murein transglycosylase
MRGIGHTLSRLPTARAVLAGAAILAGALVSAAHAGAPASGKGTGNDETAMAIPRISLRGVNAGISLPQPLSPSDAMLMQRAFALQSKGNIPAASRLAGEVQNPLLLGPLLADRYLGRFHNSTAAELAAWLKRYADQPDAPAIRALLLRRVPKGTLVPPVPVVAALAPVRAADDAAPENDDADAPTLSRNPLLDGAIAARLDRGETRAALNLIGSTKGLRPAYAALLRGEVARWLFSRSDDTAALQTAYLCLKDTPADQQPGLPAYVGGLAAWRQGSVVEARGMFELAAEAPFASPRIAAAAAFWAARAAQRMHDPAATRRWLQRAAAEPKTLYGFIARHRLGLPTGIIPSTDLLSQADIDVVAATSAGWRAFALLQIGQIDRAESELRLLRPQWQHDPVQQRSLLLVASALGMTSLAAQIVEASAAADGQAIDTLHSPVPRLRPDGGFRVDPALVYALTRVESNFDAHAVSRAGARGLMQLMPVTARYISGNAAFVSERLHDPSLNLALGQRYISYLARQDTIGDDLLHVLASYNDGPNNFAHWLASVHDNGDPLLFIEAIPNNETRAFVQRSLTYTWIYAGRLHLPAPSLDDLAADEWPRFTPAADRGKITFTAARVH